MNARIFGAIDARRGKYTNNPSSRIAASGNTHFNLPARRSSRTIASAR